MKTLTFSRKIGFLALLAGFTAACALPVFQQTAATTSSSTQTVIQPSLASTTAQTSLPPAEIPPYSLLTPADFQYLGAFRLPGEDDPPQTFDYGGSAMTVNPQGNPGSSGGLPGSLFISGHDRLAYGELPDGGQVAEIAIPQPVISHNLDDLPTAQFLQRFHNVAEGFFLGMDEIPRMAMLYLDVPQTGARIHLAWSQHLQTEPVSSHAWFSPALDSPDLQGTWFINGFHPYVVTGYLLEIPQVWAQACCPDQPIAAGRYRDGGQGAMGPSLIAYRPWVDESGTPAAPESHLPATPLLLYASAMETDAIERCLAGYQHADEWEGAAWLTTPSGGSAVLFAGTKATGDKYWYGYRNPLGEHLPCVDAAHVGEFPVCRNADGSLCPDEDLLECTGHTSQRGWWSTRFDAQFILYDPADLVRVAHGSMDSWQPQPYAIMDIDEYLLFQPAEWDTVWLGSGDQRRFRIGEAAYDRTHGYLYVLELYGDGARPVVHVWQVQ